MSGNFERHYRRIHGEGPPPDITVEVKVEPTRLQPGDLARGLTPRWAGKRWGQMDGGEKTEAAVVGGITLVMGTWLMLLLLAFLAVVALLVYAAFS